MCAHYMELSEWDLSYSWVGQTGHDHPVDMEEAFEKSSFNVKAFNKLGVEGIFPYKN